jgi:drug/metabolite transporter (DMT)-like permease
MPSLNYQFSSFWTMLQVILYTGIPCVIVQILVATALTMTKQTGVLNMMAYSMIFVSYLISIFRYNETPNLICLFGIILVIIGSAGTLLNINKSKNNNK